MSLSKKLVSNTIYNFIGKAFGIVINIVITPYIIKKIGIEAFGVWAIIFVFGGYLGLFDFGTKWAYIKYIAEYNKKGDNLSLNKIINTGLFFYFIVFISLFFILYLVKNEIPALFKITDELRKDFNFIFIIALISFVLNNIFSVFIYVPIGLQRMDLSNKINIISGFLNLLGTFIFLSIGLKLKGLVINNLIINVVQVIIFLIVSYGLIEHLKLRFSYVNKTELKKIFGFGVKNQLASMHEVASFQTDKFFIGNYLSMTFVSFYEVGTKLLTQIRYLISLILSAIVPAVSELKAENDMIRILKLYTIINKYIVTIIIPLFLLMNLYAKDIINIWVGSQFQSTVNVFYILSFGYFFNCLCGTSYVMSIGLGRPDINMKFGIIGTVLNLILSFTLIRLFGFSGLLIGTSFTLTITGIYLISMFHKLIEVNWYRFWRGIIIKPIFAALVSLVLVILLDKIILFNVKKFDMLLLLLGKSIIFIGLYTISLFLFKYYNFNDIRLIKNLLNKEKVPFFHIAKLQK